jgi:hypothetical protein
MAAAKRRSRGHDRQWGNIFLKRVYDAGQPALTISRARTVEFLKSPFAGLVVNQQTALRSTFAVKPGIAPGTHDVVHLMRIVRDERWVEDVVQTDTNPSVPILTACERMRALRLDPAVFHNRETNEYSAAPLCANGVRGKTNRGCCVYDIPEYGGSGSSGAAAVLPPLPAFMFQTERSDFVATGIAPISAKLCLLCLSQVYAAQRVCNDHATGSSSRRKATIQQFQVIIGPDGFDERFCFSLFPGGPRIVDIFPNLLAVGVDDEGKKYISEYELWWKTPSQGNPMANHLF